MDLDPAHPGQGKRQRRRGLAAVALAAVCLIAVTLLAYANVSEFDFVDFDDFAYVPQNPHVQAGLTRESLAWAFTGTHAGVLGSRALALLYGGHVPLRDGTRGLLSFQRGES